MSLAENVVKPDAVRELCNLKGWSYNPYYPPSLKAFSDRLLSEDRASEALKRRQFGREETIAAGSTFPLRTPMLLNGFPKAFGNAPGPTTITAPPFKVLRVSNGILGLVNDAPTIFDSEGFIHPDYSSFYYPLLPHFGSGNCLRIDRAIRMGGRAIVMMDDVGDTNYCHWLCNWLPRLSALPDVLEDTFVIVLGCETSWQHETLMACGFSPSRIISLSNWQAIGFRELIVPSHMSDVAHPAYRGAQWATGFLGTKLNTRPGQIEDTPSHIYLSRADAKGRRIRNEETFSAYLRDCGYQAFVASNMSVAEQAYLFRSAKSIVSLHGAGLANIVFCQSGCRVLEIVPENYGTPAFWMLANGRGVEYATYIANSLTTGGISQNEDIEVDLEHFKTVANNWICGRENTSSEVSCMSV